MLVAQKYQVRRSEVIALVKDLIGVDLMFPQSSEDIAKAVFLLDHLRMKGLEQGLSFRSGLLKEPTG